MSQPKASVIILVWNGIGYLESCLDAVVIQDYSHFEVVVVDNGSTDGSPDFVAHHYPQVKLIRNECNAGFSAGNNIGLRKASGELLVLLNQDTVVQPGWLAALAAEFDRHPDAGIVGSKILDPDGQTLQHAGGRIEHPSALGQHYGYGELDEGQYDEPCQVEFVTGAAMALKREVLSTIGDLDEGFYPGYFEDVDFCSRARAAGYSVWYAPQAVLRHYESASMRRDSLTGHYYYYRNRLRFVLKHRTPDQIIEGFVPAEIARSAHAPSEELRASALSTIEGLTIWPFMARQREPLPTQAEYKAVLNALRRLLDALIRFEQLAASTIADPTTGSEVPDPSEPLRTGTSVSTDRETSELRPFHLQETMPMAEPRTVPESALSPATTRTLPWALDGEARQLLGSQPYSRLRHALELLDQAGKVTPRPFTSHVPLLGPLIVAFRDFVNNLATRWYVQALLDQQVAFNAGVTQLLTQTSLLPEHQSGFLAEHVADLHWQVLALKSQIAKLEEELERRTGHTTGSNRD